MTRSPIPKLNRQILEEAAEWFVDFRMGDVDSAARSRFDEWLRRSPEHIRAYWEIAKTYVELPSATEAEGHDVSALIAFARSNGNVIPFHAAAPASEVGKLTEGHGMVGFGHPRRRRILAAAACTALVAAAGSWWWQDARHPSYSTDIGERRSLTLADGSTVDLNSRSSIRVEFSATERRIELADGQALFQVVKDKTRPFIVRSGAATVRAVGTQFDVYRKDSGTTVTVLEGRVAIYSNGPLRPTAGGSARPALSAPDSPSRRVQGAPVLSNHEESRSVPSTTANVPGLADPTRVPTLFLSAGERVTVTEDGAPAPQRVDLSSATAWTQRRLIFDDTRLSDVVDEFNRYNHRQLVVASEELADFRISGVYSSTDPASLLRFLGDQPDVRIIEERDQIRISSH